MCLTALFVLVLIGVAVLFGQFALMALGMGCVVLAVQGYRLVKSSTGGTPRIVGLLLILAGLGGLVWSYLASQGIVAWLT